MAAHGKLRAEGSREESCRATLRASWEITAGVELHRARSAHIHHASTIDEQHTAAALSRRSPRHCLCRRRCRSRGAPAACEGEQWGTVNTTAMDSHMTEETTTTHQAQRKTTGTRRSKTEQQSTRREVRSRKAELLSTRDVAADATNRIQIQ